MDLVRFHEPEVRIRSRQTIGISPFDWVHPDDSIPWVHVDNLVEMINLVIEKGTSGQVYNAIDGNYSEKDFRMRFISALGKAEKFRTVQLNTQPILTRKSKNWDINHLKHLKKRYQNLLS